MTRVAITKAGTRWQVQAVRRDDAGRVRASSTQQFDTHTQAMAAAPGLAEEVAQ